MNDKSCRLCSRSNADPHLNIFSGIGSEMGMVDILSEHFKCDISEADPLPNVVCQRCWTTTDAFHELYKESKLVQEKFLNSLVKIEPDLIDVVVPNDNNGLIIETNVKISPLEEDESLGYTESENLPVIMNSNDNSEEEGGEENDTKNDSEYETGEQTSKRKQWQSKKSSEEYQRIFNENKHLFDMTCDYCTKIFESLEEARTHYSADHNDTKGYIKFGGKKMFRRAQVMQHVARHLNSIELKCTECDRILYTKKYLEKHIKRHEKMAALKGKLFQCEICKKSFKKSNLEKHKKAHENDPPENKLYDQFMVENFTMSCDLCDAKFTGFYDARQHYKDSHNENNGYLKSCCGTKLTKPHLVRDHIKSHLISETFKCELCNKTFATRKLMADHRRRHKPLICDYCGKAFHRKNSIVHHLFTNHVSAEPKFECEICHKKFQLQTLLRSHWYAVHQVKKANVTCEICGKSFNAKFYLKKHMVTAHTDKSERLAMRTQCEHCGEWLMSKSGIYYHKQLHTTGVQKCEQCAMELPNKLALKRHILEYHRAHKHKCSYCAKTFASAYKLKSHEESHTRHKTYQCNFCPKMFTVSSSLKMHRQRNHKKELEMSKQIA